LEQALKEAEDCVGECAAMWDDGTREIESEIARAGDERRAKRRRGKEETDGFAFAME